MKACPRSQGYACCWSRTTLRLLRNRFQGSESQPATAKAQVHWAHFTGLGRLLRIRTLQRFRIPEFMVSVYLGWPSALCTRHRQIGEGHFRRQARRHTRVGGEFLSAWEVVTLTYTFRLPTCVGLREEHLDSTFCGHSASEVSIFKCWSLNGVLVRCRK
jgi:hypothetical protein